MRTRARFLDIAIALFGILVILAMATYHGGSHGDALAGSYEFRANYLSDLGRVVTFAGRPNALPRALFAGATVLVGSALAWSAPAWRAWNTSGRAASFANGTVVSAVLAGTGFAAVGLVPQDRMLGAHVFVVDAAFAWLLAFVGSLTVVQFRNRAPRTLWITNLVVLMLLAGYVLWVLGADLRDPTTLRISIAAQKVAVVVAMLDVALQAGGLIVHFAATSAGRPLPPASPETGSVDYR